MILSLSSRTILERWAVVASSKNLKHRLLKGSNNSNKKAATNTKIQVMMKKSKTSLMKKNPLSNT
jgi:hypothetical protein